jgi:iron complex transport system substrate-binding protein
VPSLNELIIAVGAGEHLVARTDFDSHPDILDLPSVGGGLDPNLETILSLGVGVILTPGGRDAGALGTRLEELGLEVHALPTNTVADLYGAIAELGRMFEVAATADSLTGSMKREIEEIRGRVAGRELVSVMYVVGADPPMTTGSGTFIHDLIRIAGGRNAFADVGAGWPSVSFEAIVNRDPDFLVWPRGAYNTVEVENLGTTPGWRDVPAVRDGRVLFVDGNLFTRPGPGFPEAARILASAFHPGAFEFPPAARP